MYINNDVMVAVRAVKNRHILTQYSNWPGERCEREGKCEVDKSLAQVGGRIDLVLTEVERLNNKQVWRKIIVFSFWTLFQLKQLENKPSLNLVAYNNHIDISYKSVVWVELKGIISCLLHWSPAKRLEGRD